MNHHAFSYKIALTCFLLSGCAVVNTDLTKTTSPIDSNSNLPDYQKTCQSMTYAPNGYTVEEDTYIYSSRHEFRPMEQSTLKYKYVRHQDKKVILANEKELARIRKIYPDIPDYSVQKQYRADLCYAVASEVLYFDHPVVKLSKKMNDLYNSCPEDKCAQSIAEALEGKSEPLTQGTSGFSFKSQAETCYVAFLPNNGRLTPIQMDVSDIAHTQRFQFHYPDIVRPFDGLCTTHSEDITIPNAQNPIVISIARHDFPISLATYVDAIIPAPDEKSSCPIVDRDDEYTYTKTLKHNTFPASMIMSKPRPMKSKYKVTTMDCSHPYKWFDYFTHPVPGTLYYYNDAPVIITKHTKNDDALVMTVVTLGGEILTVSPNQLTHQPNTTPNIPPMTSAQCLCSTNDTIPAEAKHCESAAKFFDCCEQAVREKGHDKFKDELSLNAYIYHACRLDQTKAYEIQSNIWAGHDPSFIPSKYFTKMNASQTASPISDIARETSILTRTYPINVRDLMAGKPLSK